MIIPERWTDVLRQLHQGGFPEAIIAGGALRDLHNEKPIKDVDVFVRPSQSTLSYGERVPDSSLTYDTLRAALGYEGQSIFEVNNLDEDYPWNPGQCWGIWNFRHLSDVFRSSGLPPFQVITLDFPAITFAQDVINDFDIGFCQIALTGMGTAPSFMPEYATDYWDKTLTVVKAPDQRALERTISRLQRLRAKYPGFMPRNVWVQPRLEGVEPKTEEALGEVF